MAMPSSASRKVRWVTLVVLGAIAGTCLPGMANATVDWELWEVGMDTGWVPQLPLPEDEAEAAGTVLMIPDQTEAAD